MSAIYENRPFQVSMFKPDKLNTDNVMNNITAPSYIKLQQTTQQENPRTVPIPELPKDITYPPSITIKAPNKLSKKKTTFSMTKSSNRKKGTPLDLIDKLDVSGMYSESSFHHDGPFDACRPHRNQRNSRAPVAAFPADGPNNTLKGVNYQIGNQKTEDRIMGRMENEAFKEFSNGVQQHQQQTQQLKKQNHQYNDSQFLHDSGFDPTIKSNPVHGNTTLGLGTSTFLDGAPAPKAVETKPKEKAQPGSQQITRKKSLVQRLRGNSYSNGSSSSTEKVRERAAVTPMPPIPTEVEISSPEVVSYSDLEIKPPSSQSLHFSSSNEKNDGKPLQSTSGSLLRRVKSLKMVTSRSRRTVTEQS